MSRSAASSNRPSRVAIRADSSGSALTSATTRPGSRRRPLTSSTSGTCGSGASAVLGVAPVAGTTCRTLTTLVAPMCALVAACSICVAFCTGQDRNAAKPYVETS